jgi:hypothetical protein
LREGDDRRLGRAVGGEVAVGGVGGHRRDVDDLPAAAGEHARPEREAPVGDAVEVDRSQPLPVFDAALEKGTQNPDTGIVDENIDGPHGLGQSRFL